MKLSTVKIGQISYIPPLYSPGKLPNSSLMDQNYLLFSSKLNSQTGMNSCHSFFQIYLPFKRTLVNRLLSFNCFNYMLWCTFWLVFFLIPVKLLCWLFWRQGCLFPKETLQENTNFCTMKTLCTKLDFACATANFVLILQLNNLWHQNILKINSDIRLGQQDFTFSEQAKSCSWVNLDYSLGQGPGTPFAPTLKYGVSWIFSMIYHVSLKSFFEARLLG